MPVGGEVSTAPRDSLEVMWPFHSGSDHGYAGAMTDHGQGEVGY